MAARAHGSSGYASGCRCDDCRSGHRERLRPLNAARRAARRVALGPRTCKGCGAEFPRLGKRLFCTPECKRKFDSQSWASAKTSLQRDRHEGKGWRRRQAEARIAKAAEGTRSTRVWISGECGECGEQFARIGFASAFCSKRCSGRVKRRERRAREVGVHISKVRRLRIHERDAWTCHICGDPVNPDARVPELDAPTLDHVIALANGGAHDEANLKTAHFYCNSVKRDLPLASVA